jgi:hypothetical protein
MPDDESQLPELARSLRTLGAARDAATEAAHDAIFTPLIDARVRAARATGRDVIALLRGATLYQQIERGVVTAASNGAAPPAVARARAAAAREMLEPVRAALVAVDDRASAASTEGLGTAAWEAWLVELRRVFGAADDACVKLARLLAVPPRLEEPSRWFGPRGR